MKRIITLFIVIFIFTTTVYSGEKDSWWGSYYMPGNFAVKGAIGLETSSDSTNSFSFYPEAELIILKPSMWGFSPVDLGVAVRGHIGLGFSDTTLDSNLSAGIGVLGTFHFGFKGVGSYFTDFEDSPTGFFSQLSRFDYFFGMGPVFDFISYNDGSDMIGLGVTSGVNYFVNENLAVTLEGNWWNGFAGGGIGLVYKIGPSQNVSELDIKLNKLDIDLDPLYMQVYLAQFYSVYWYSFYAGGFYFDDDNYEAGQGTTWKLVSEDNDELIIEKALLKINSNGSEWWKIVFSSDGEEIIYEFLIDSDYNLLKLRFIDEDTNEIREYITNSEDLKTYHQAEMDRITDSDYDKFKKGKITVKTDAGTFVADHLEYTDDSDIFKYQWWVANNVPGLLVQFSWENEEDSMTGELIRISEKNKSELNSF